MAVATAPVPAPTHAGVREDVVEPTHVGYTPRWGAPIWAAEAPIDVPEPWADVLPASVTPIAFSIYLPR